MSSAAVACDGLGRFLLGGVAALLARWSDENRVELDGVSILATGSVAEQGRYQLSIDPDFSLIVLCRCLERYRVADLSRSSDCAGRFLFAHYSGDGPECPQGAGRAAPGSSGSGYDVVLHAYRAGGEMRLCWQFNEAVFHRRTITGLGEALTHLLLAASEHPDLAVGSLPLTAATRVLPGCAPVDHGSFLFVHQRIEQQALGTPELVALEFCGKHLTYREVNERANRLAHLLRIRHRVGRGSAVAICMHRGMEMVLALLAVLKAGGAYVPLDPIYPPKRVADVLQDAGVELALSCAAERHLLPERIHTLCLDDPEFSGRLAALPTRNLSVEEVGLTPGALAYIIYTSGSTGQPKGVCIEHRSFGRFIPSVLHQLAQTERHRWLALISLSFDMSLVDLFAPLCRADTVVIAPTQDVGDGYAIQRLMAACDIDALQATPTTWNMLLAANWPGNERLLAISGGEPLTGSLVDELLPRCRQLWNGYGPTEITVYSLLRQIHRSDERLTQLSIGGPLPNARHYVLDSQLRPVPDGMVGMLYVGGPGVARGYHNRPQLTAQQFIADPMDTESGARLYKTGDRVRTLPDGNLQYLGRADLQLKLRGYRIEPGEIEHLLQRAAEVEQAVVDVRCLREEAILVAFVRLRPRAALSAQAGEVLHRLRNELKALLPPYMVPGQFVAVDEFPKTASGKLDRKALSLADRVALASLGPATQMEATLLALARRVFKWQGMGVTDSFHELGGHSLQLWRLRALMSAELGYEPELHALFEYDSVRSLGEYLQTQVKGNPLTARADLSDEDSDGTLPLTPMQQAMWLTSQIPESASSYNVPLYFDCEGLVDGEALQSGLDRLTRRFAALRASFFVNDTGQVRQRLLPDRRTVLRRTDLSDLDATVRQERLAELIAQEAARPFDLERDCLLRAAVLTVSRQRHVLLLTLHHIVVDEESIALILGELARPMECEPAVSSRSYAGFILRKSATRDAARELADLAYWEKRLENMPQVHSVPLDRPRGANRSFKGAKLEQAVERELCERVRQFAKESKSTVFCVYHAALAALLSRLSGAKDIVIGVPISERQGCELGQDVGCQIQTALVRMELDDESTFADLLQLSKRRIGEAIQHRDVSLAALAKRLELAPGASHTPWYQIMLTQQMHDYYELRCGDLRLRQFYPSQFASQTDLLVNLCEVADGMRLRWEYDSELWRQESIERMAQLLSMFVDLATTDPTLTPGAFPMSTGATPNAHAELNQTAVDFGPFSFVHERFEQQCALTPNAAAVCFQQQEWSYAQLNTRADQLARYLRTRGVKPATCVAVCVGRGFEMIVALMATLKAGASYLPLDPAHPVERIRYMIEDAGAALVITERQVAGKLDFGGASFFCLDDPIDELRWQTEEARNPDAAELGLRPDHDAYVIYTSGSTGRPKGVCIQHSAFANFMSAMSLRLPRTQARRWLAVISPTFDMSTVELFFPLISGDCVVVAADEDTADGDRLKELLAQHRIDAFQVTPSTWQLLLAAGWMGSKDLLAIAGGEPLSQGLAHALLERCRELWNGYGPTEITVYSLLRPVVATDDVTQLLSIGQPLANTRHYVLDEHMQPVPPGVPGQLCIGGAGLARGYLNQSELTAEKFVMGALPGDAPQRLYKTGDWVRLLPSGDMQFIGRTDSQIKLRGYRIDLGEIEQVLLSQSDVAQAVVELKRWGDNAALVGFVVLDPRMGSSHTGAQARLKSVLSARLPNYMVPEVLVLCGAFPRTSSGKVDRKALLERVVWQREVVLPEGDTERQVARIWSEILNIGTVGVTSSFFMLGGHSILVTRMIYMIRQVFGVAMEIRWVFEEPTVRGIAGKIDTMLALRRSAQGFSSAVHCQDVEL